MVPGKNQETLLLDRECDFCCELGSQLVVLSWTRTEQTGTGRWIGHDECWSRQWWQIREVWWQGWKGKRWIHQEGVKGFKKGIGITLNCGSLRARADTSKKEKLASEKGNCERFSNEETSAAASGRRRSMVDRGSRKPHEGEVWRSAVSNSVGEVVWFNPGFGELKKVRVVGCNDISWMERLEGRTDIYIYTDKKC